MTVLSIQLELALECGDESTPLVEVHRGSEVVTGVFPLRLGDGQSNLRNALVGILPISGGGENFKRLTKKFPGSLQKFIVQ